MPVSEPAASTCDHIADVCATGTLLLRRADLTVGRKSVNCTFRHGDSNQSDRRSIPAAGDAERARVPPAGSCVLLWTISARAFRGGTAARHRSAGGGSGEVGSRIAARAAPAAVARKDRRLSPPRAGHIRESGRPRLVETTASIVRRF